MGGRSQPAGAPTPRRSVWTRARSLRTLPQSGFCCGYGFRTTVAVDTTRGATLAKVAREWARVLKPASRAVLLTSEAQLPALREALRGSGRLHILCERPCALGYSKAVIVVAERGSDDEHEAAERDATRAADDESAATGGADVVVVARALPWEEPNGRRSDWYALRKTNRTPMVPFCLARSPLRDREGRDSSISYVDHEIE